MSGASTPGGGKGEVAVAVAVAQGAFLGWPGVHESMLMPMLVLTLRIGLSLARSANMTMGMDMSPLFGDVVACMAIQVLEIKKMVSVRGCSRLMRGGRFDY